MSEEAKIVDPISGAKAWVAKLMSGVLGGTLKFCIALVVLGWTANTKLESGVSKIVDPKIEQLGKDLRAEHNADMRVINTQYNEVNKKLDLLLKAAVNNRRRR